MVTTNLETAQSLSMAAKLMIFFVIRTKGHITKTQLVKFLYLADLYAVKWHGHQITDLKWFYYLRGPWEDAFQEELDNLQIAGVFEISPEGQALLIKPGSGIMPEESLEIPKSMEFVLDNIRVQWTGAGDRLQQLLDYVYDSAPMKAVKAQGKEPKDRAPLNLLAEREAFLEALEAG